MTYFHSTLLHNHIHCTCMVDSSIVESTLISYNLFYWSNSVLLGEQLYKYCTTPLMCLFFLEKKGIEFYSSTSNAFRMNNSEICRLSLGNDSKMWGGCSISMIEDTCLTIMDVVLFLAIVKSCSLRYSKQFANLHAKNDIVKVKKILWRNLYPYFANKVTENIFLNFFWKFMNISVGILAAYCSLLSIFFYSALF